MSSKGDVSYINVVFNIASKTDKVSDKIGFLTIETKGTEILVMANRSF